MQPITNSQIALEFFANILALKGLISVDVEEAICNATCIEDLDEIADRLALEVSGDE